jgi:RNA polymerase sigma-70 factor (sigma-E family)
VGVSITMGVMAQPVTTGIEAPAFEAFFHEHHEPLLRVLYLSTGDRHEAEDLAQEAFVRVYERWDRVRTLGDPRGYLYRTALNLRRSRLRRLTVAARRLVGGRSELAADPADATGSRDEVRRALAALPDGQREALLLCEWLEMTDVEAGSALGISAGAVRVRLSRSRAAMRRELRGDE